MTFGVMGSGGTPASDFLVERSFRIVDNTSTYLSRTPSVAGNQKTFTYSFWMKRGWLLTSATDYQRLYTSNAVGDESFRFEPNNRFAWFSNGSQYYVASTTGLCTQSDSWYHIVFTVDTTQTVAADRTKLWVNNVARALTAVTSTPPLNYATGVNSTGYFRIGTSAAENNDASFAEVYLLDGIAATPTDFGETNVDGEWIPKKYTGSYGTNGFYLNFSNTSSTAAFGYDYSGNGNNLTSTGVTIALNASYDVPTATSTLAGNYCVLSNINYSTGSLTTGVGMIIPVSSAASGNMGMASGKWYWEVTSTGGTTAAGVMSESGAVFATTSIATGLTYGFTYDADSNVLQYTTDGTTYTTIATSAYVYYTYAATDATAVATVNHGQLAFAYTVPTNFKRLNSFNVPAAVKSTTGGMQYTYNTSGTGLGRTLNARFRPDFLIVKGSSASYSTIVASPAIGNGYFLIANSSAAVANSSGGSTVDAGTSGVCNSSTLIANLAAVGGNGYRITTTANTASVANITYSELGAAALTSSTVWTAGSADDGYWTLTIPWNVSFLGSSYTSISFGTNFYVTFGGASSAYSALSASNPAFPKIMISAGDNAAQRIYYGTEGTAPNRTYRVRFEGTVSRSVTAVGSPTKLYEMIFYENTPSQIDLQVMLNPTITVATANVVFGTSSVQLSGGYVDDAAYSFGSWQFNKSPSFGIDRVTYTGTGATQNINHSLGVAPEFILIKDRSVGDWIAWTTSITSSYAYTFNTGSARTLDATMWGGAPTSSVFSVSTNVNVNASGHTYDAYLFTSVKGFSRVGSYTGNGSTAGPYIWCGFRPGLVMIKRREAASVWHISSDDIEFFANNMSASLFTRMTSGGFKLTTTGTDVNTSGAVYDYISIAQAPITTAKSRT